MNEKGFATIFGLCLILVIALIVKGIQEAEMNHAYETTDFQAEFDLQNAADSALVEAIDLVLSKSVTLPTKDDQRARQYSQYQFPTITKTSERLGNITVTVWGEEALIQPYKVNYKSNGKNVAEKDKDKNRHSGDGYFFFSRAEATITGGKIYRRAAAYVLQSENYKTIHFMEVPMSEYTFAK